MATGVSLEYIYKKVVAFHEVFPNLDKQFIYGVVEQCQYDFNMAGNILAEMNRRRSNFQEAAGTIHHVNSNNFIENNRRLNSPYDNIISLIKQGYKVMVLMRGLPGSGKSILALQLLRESLGEANKNEFIFSADQYFSDNHDYNSQELNEAYQWSHKRCFSNMKKGVSPIIIDEANLQMKKIKIYCVMAVQFGYIIEIADPLAPWALHPKVLATKISLEIDEGEIEETLARFQQNFTVKDLFKEFELEYSDQMPQYRKYPPLSVIPKHTNQTNIVPGTSDTQSTPQRRFGLLKKEKPPVPTRNFPKSEEKHGIVSKNLETNIETHNQGINTIHSDFGISNKDTITNSLGQKTSRSASNKIDFVRSTERDSTNKGWTIEEEELFWKLYRPDREVVQKLKNLYLNIPLHEIFSTYEKCKKNIFRTEDILRNFSTNSDPTKTIENLERNSSSKNFDHAPVSKFTSSALNNPNVTSPNKDVNIQEIDEEATKRKQQEMAPKNIEKQEDLKLTHDDNLDIDSKINEMIGDLTMLPETFNDRHHIHQSQSDYQKLLSEIVSIHSLSKENENFIKKLEKEKRKSDSENNNANVDHEEWKNITPDALALKLTRQKLYAALPHIEPKVLDDVLEAYDNDYVLTFTSISKTRAVPSSPSSIIENPFEPPISDMVLNEMRKQYLLVNEVLDKSQSAVKSVASCKNEASRHVQNRLELLQLAEQQRKLRNYEVAIFYIHLIEMEHEKAVAAINDAVYLFIQEYAKKSVRLFLHFLIPEHAAYVLDMFLDHHISNLNIVNKAYDYYFVITDRGKANEDSLSKGEQVIKKRLEDRKIPFESIDSDTLRIKVEKNLPMSIDVQKR